MNGEWMTDQQLIASAVELSGLSPDEFAASIISRDERTVRNWRSGRVSIPPAAKRWLLAWVALDAKARGAIVVQLHGAMANVLAAQD